MIWRFLIFLLPSLMFGAAVSINNDSPFPLHAQILSANGEILGSISVPPQQQMTWQNSNLNSGNVPMVPYTIIFYCLEGIEYGLVSDIGNGATAFASQSIGRKVCKPQTPEERKKEIKEMKKDPSLQDVNPQQWSKDQLNNDFPN